MRFCQSTADLRAENKWLRRELIRRGADPDTILNAARVRRWRKPRKRA